MVNMGLTKVDRAGVHLTRARVKGRGAVDAVVLAKMRPEREPVGQNATSGR